MKNQFAKSLAVFNKIAIIMLLFHSVQAQIVYTDVKPDQKFNTDGYTYPIDLNGDGTTDFTIDYIVTSYGCHYNSKQGVDIMITTSDQSEVANNALYTTVDSNTSIKDGPLTWNSDTAQIIARRAYVCVEWYHGDWVLLATYKGSTSGVSNKFIPVRLINDSMRYYGWIRINYGNLINNSFPKVTIKDFACNTIPDSSILAGQSCPPQAVIIANGPTTFCAGDSVILSSANTGTNLSYKWKLNGTNINGATDKNFTVKIAGKYKVNVTDSTNSCSATSALLKVKVPCKVMSEEMEDETDLVLNVFPNPMSTSTTILFFLPQSENVSLRIFDVEGKLIRTLANESMRVGEHTFTWDGRGDPEGSGGNAVSEGIYFLQLQSVDITLTEKLIVTK